MATIYNSDLTRELVEGAKIQTSKDSVPNQISEKVVACMETNPKLIKESTVLAQITGRNTTATSATFLAAKPSEDVYITGISVSNVQDAACDNVAIFVTASFNGIGRYVYNRRKAAGALAFSDNIQFPNPLKIDRNTVITITLAFTAGTSTADFVLTGYTLNSNS